VITAGEQVQHDAQPLGAAARRGPEYNVGREAADHRANESAVTVAADQDVDAVANVTPLGGLPSLHPQHWHQRESLMPERYHNGGAGGMRRHVLVALERPARGP
jgi:hypothetical protein